MLGSMYCQRFYLHNESAAYLVGERELIIKQEPKLLFPFQTMQ